ITAQGDPAVEERLPEAVAALHRHHRAVVARLRRQYRHDLHTHTDDRTAHAHNQTRGRTAVDGVAALAVRVGDLQAAVEVFIGAAAGRSGAAMYGAAPATGAGLDEAGRQAVSAAAGSIQAVQPILVTEPRQRAAVIGALADAARQSGRPVWLARTAPHPADTGTGQRLPAGLREVDPVEAVAAMADRHQRLPIGGLLLVDGAEQLPREALTALCLHAGATNTKLVLVSDLTSGGPSRELCDTLAGLPWAHTLNPTSTGRSVVERAAAWAATHPPATASSAESGRDLPGWLRTTLTDAAAQRSPVVIGRPPAESILAGLDPSARRAVERIATSPTLVHTLDCDTTVDGGQGKTAVLSALTRTGGAGQQLVVMPVGPAAEQAAEQPYQRYVRDQKAIANALGRRTWQPPPGSRVVLDGADHLDTNTLVGWLRTAAHHNLNLVLVTDRANPGPQRHLTDTLAAAAPWAAHHLDATDTQQHAVTMVGRLVEAHTRLIDTHHAAGRAIADHLERTRHQQRDREQHRSRDDGYDISL
ncbi:MAG: hypothetical protein KDB50_16725, partial [Mycobacterium sp.]|nr:hypothetical protein [Mycobacterium sp.]